ncbi:MAG: YiiX/YebB-like N1pC/P60 family cysteine hydrolase [Myxococcota bacterium]
MSAEPDPEPSDETEEEPPESKRGWVPAAVMTLFTASIILWLPDPPHPPPADAELEPFVWDQDDVWATLQQDFERSREDCTAVAPDIDGLFADIDVLLASIEERSPSFDSPVLVRLEETLFKLGPKVAACPTDVERLFASIRRLRRSVKLASRGWGLSQPEPRRRLYRLLYGARATAEEVMLQLPDDQVPSLWQETEEPSSTPSIDVEGVAIHSGDILVSRGGAPTSAFISRGSDYPGNFSHIGLAYVSEEGEGKVIEAHIERGVAVAAAEEYLKDTKLRIMVLRLRSDLLEHDRSLPHRAAEAALARASEGHIPYDFAMDYQRSREMFCSEVASEFYDEEGIKLWEGMTTMSSSGLIRWLSSLGVRYFETQGPSDLEYDPQLVVVAEWRDPETLFDDHVDNAVIDAMLETAEAGADLDYDWVMLGPARVVKGYSTLLNAMGDVGPIP